MNRVCAADACDDSLDGCRHDGSRKPAQARFCSSTCRDRTKKSNYRKRKRRGLLAARHPEAAQLLESTRSESLTELYERAGDPPDWTDLDDDHHLDDDHQDHLDDDPGIYSGGQLAPDPWQQSHEAEANLLAAIDVIKADFDRRAQKYLLQQKRNPGPMRPELAALLRERDSKISELTRAHQLAQALEWAARDRPWRVASAHERQVEQAAARSFAMDLRRGRFLRAEPESAGRDVHQTWIW